MQRMKVILIYFTNISVSFYALPKTFYLACSDMVTYGWRWDSDPLNIAIYYVSNLSCLVMTGFVDPFEFCCGSFYGYHINCGQRATVNGTVYGNPCHNPSMHISWDGIHYSDAANLWIAKRILNGSLSDPPVSIGEACYHTNNL